MIICGSIRSWRRAVFAGTTAVLLGVAFSIFINSNTPSDHQPDVRVKAHTQGGSQHNHAQPSTGATANQLANSTVLLPSVQMPEATLPLAEQLGALIQLAQAGDPEAACRLFIGTRRCRMVTQRLRRAEQMQQHLEQGQTSRISEDMAVLSIANALEQTRALAAWCDGVDPAQHPNANALAERAFDNMTSAQKVLLVMSRQDGSIARMPRHFGSSGSLGGTTGFIYPQFLSDHGYSILEEGIRQANPLALEGMIMLHSPSWIPGSEEAPRISMPDRQRFVQYGLLMTYVFGEDDLGPIMSDTIARSLASMDPDKRAEAERWAEYEAERWRAQMLIKATQNKVEGVAERGVELECGGFH